MAECECAQLLADTDYYERRFCTRYVEGAHAANAGRGCSGVPVSITAGGQSWRAKCCLLAATLRTSQLGYAILQRSKRSWRANDVVRQAAGQRCRLLKPTRRFVNGCTLPHAGLEHLADRRRNETLGSSIQRASAHEE